MCVCFFPSLSGFERVVAYRVMTVEKTTKIPCLGFVRNYLLGVVYFFFFCEVSVYHYRCGVVWYGSILGGNRKGR